MSKDMVREKHIALLIKENQELMKRCLELERRLEETQQTLKEYKTGISRQEQELELAGEIERMYDSKTGEAEEHRGSMLERILKEDGDA